MQNEPKNTPLTSAEQDQARLEHEFSTARLLEALSRMGVPKDEIRPAALPTFNGESDEGILAGGVTAAEAFELFKSWVADSAHHQAIGTIVTRISPATVAGRKVWLPDLSGGDAARKHFRQAAGEFKIALDAEKTQHMMTKSDLDALWANLRAARAALVVATFDRLEGKDHPRRRKFRTEAHAEAMKYGASQKQIDAESKAAVGMVADWFRLSKAKTKPKPKKRAPAKKKPVKRG